MARRERGAEHDFDVFRSGCREFIDKSAGPVVTCNHGNAAAGELRLQLGRDHAPFPRTPVQGFGNQRRALALLDGEQAGHRLVGHRVVDLADVAEATGHRRKHNQRFERVAAGVREQRQQAEHLGVDDLVDLLGGLVFDLLVGEHAGAVNDDVDAAETTAHVVEGRANAGVALHVAGEQLDFSALLQLEDRRTHFTRGENLLSNLCDFTQRYAAAAGGGVGEDRSLEGAFVVGLARKRRLGTIDDGALQDRELEARHLLRQRERTGRCDPAGTAGDNDDIASNEP